MRPGDVIAGKYRIERVLGAGGMGVVVAAQHMQLDTRVAIKLLLPHMLASRDALERFSREARAAVKITSEHVARVLDVGTLEGGVPYMVMEFLEGDDLAAWVKRHGVLPVEQAVDFVLQACVAVAEAHAAGIVHRDLKPSNLFCVRRSDGQLLVKVLDFGISKLGDAGAGGLSPSVTSTSAMMGSPLYMSPEQMQSARRADAQSDIWALGVILYQFIVGRVPFVGESLGEVMAKVLAEPAPPLRRYRPDVPIELDEAILKCLEKDKGRRFRNVGEVAFALAPFAPKRSRASIERIMGTIQSAGLSASAREPPSSSPAPPPEAALATRTSAAPVSRTSHEATRGAFRRRSLLALVVASALGILFVAGGVGVFLVRPPKVAGPPAVADAGLTAAAQLAPPASTQGAPPPSSSTPTTSAFAVPSLVPSAPPSVPAAPLSTVSRPRTMAPPVPSRLSQPVQPPVRPSRSASSEPLPTPTNPLNLSPK